jgi:uncharacterized repeat protein (TIGR03803 family)
MWPAIEDALMMDPPPFRNMAAAWCFMREQNPFQRNRQTKAHIKNPFLLAGLFAALGLMLGGRVTAQTFTTLHNFTANDGANPFGSLILSGMTLYSTTQAGGSFRIGTIFTFNANGTGFTNLYDFTGGNDGAAPSGNLILSGNTLYGTAGRGGNSNYGTVFAINTDGSGFTNLHSFTGSDGVTPNYGLALSGSTLYGTAQFGGASGNGSVFAVNTNGTGFQTVHTFSPIWGSGTNGDGAWPSAPLVLSGTVLFGTAELGGTWDNGTLFRLNTDGSTFMTLHDFTASLTNSLGVYTNGDGANPVAALIQSGITLYGTAEYGGGSGNGTVFKLNTNGTGFTTLHTFSGSDGAYPTAGLILSGSILYGTTPQGGGSGNGTIFAVNTDGTGFTNLYNFTGGSDGANPMAGLILSANTLYGTTSAGGNGGLGTVFGLSFPPLLSTIPSGPNLILTWPTNFAGFEYTGYTLQSTTDLGSSVWNTNLPAPVVVNGENMVTNTISGTQRFYRLSQRWADAAP